MFDIIWGVVVHAYREKACGVSLVHQSIRSYFEDMKGASVRINNIAFNAFMLLRLCTSKLNCLLNSYSESSYNTGI